MQYNLKDFKNHPGVRSFRHPNLPIIGFKYSEETSFSKNWDHITRAARGISFCEKTGELVSLPFTKFFNSGEIQNTETILDWSRDNWNSFSILEKLDGSMVQAFLYQDEIVLSTPGSYESDQANIAYSYLPDSELIKSALRKFDLLTIMFEFIHSSSAVVVNYPQSTWGLKVIGARSCYGPTLGHSKLLELSEFLSLECTKKFDFKSSQQLFKFLYEDNNAVPFEGVVIHKEATDERLKIKTPLYTELHATMTGVHPNRIFNLLPKNKTKYTLEEFKEAISMYESSIESAKFLSADFSEVSNQLIAAFKELSSEVESRINNARIKLQEFLNDNINEFYARKMIGLDSSLDKDIKNCIFYILNGEEPKFSKSFFEDRIKNYFKPNLI